MLSRSMARRGYPIAVALDQGTTGTRAVRYALRDDRLVVEGDAYREHAQHTPAPGHVEHDAEEIAAAAAAVLDEVGGGADALGIANQTETLVAWDAETRRPLHRALVWQSRQGVEACARLAPHASALRDRTGLLLDPTFSALKLAWLLEHVPAVGAAAERGTLRLGTIDCWLVDRLTGGAAHVTDASNASRTLLFDLDAGAFAPDLCALAGAPADALPAVVDSAGVVGETAAGVPVAALLGDQQAALFGHGARAAGQAKCTYGTGAMVLACTGTARPQPPDGLLATVAWRLGGVTTYALDGTVFVAGDVVRWLRDGLGLIEHAADVEALAASVPDAGGAILVPAFAGLGAPDWDPAARGILTGLTAGTTRGHLARAALEAIAFQVADLLALMATAGVAPDELRVDGGAAANRLLLELQADLAGVRLARSADTELTCRGAAALALIGAGLAAVDDERLAAPPADLVLAPGLDAGARAARHRDWRAAVALARTR